MRILLSAFVLAGCVCSLSVPSTGEAARETIEVENHSFAATSAVETHHLVLDLKVDFDRRVISGKVSLHIRNVAGSGVLLLDTRGLKIDRVTLGTREIETVFQLGESQGYLGEPLSIKIAPSTRVVHVYYETSPEAAALGWLEPGQTAGGKAPFLYTQGQAILNRSWIPCPDHPGIRVTYEATIHTRPGLMAVMSARNATERSSDGVYRFSMPQPIPPYLIALAVGDIEYRRISDRCGVFAEPSVVDAAAWEFADTERMMRAAEKLYGPYRWERYDVLVLPPSFPYGGMENPRLTFVTPVLVAGDRSLVSTVAHELAHSWSGNLVTNATWDDFWLNEGFTTYFERRILEAVYDREYAEMQAELGLVELMATLQDFGEDHPDSRLHLDTSGRDPDDASSSVAYEKGYLLLRKLEETVGRKRWDDFLRGYFDRFSFQTMTTGRFVRYLRDELVDEALDAQIGIDTWVNGTGLPGNRPRIHSESVARVKREAARWKDGARPDELNTADWTGPEWKQFVMALPDTIALTRMRELDRVFRLSASRNAELLQVWFLHAIDSGYEPAYAGIESYLKRIGRVWLIRPIYKKLCETPAGKRLAARIYREARPGYHAIAAAVVDRILEKGR